MSSTLKKLRRLTLWLIVSGSFNIVLLTFFVYWVIKERPLTQYCEHKPTHVTSHYEPTNSDVIKHFQSLSLLDLYSKLSSQKLVENGYAERDLALGYLVVFHYFDLPRALHGFSKLSKPRFIESIPVFPALSDTHFKAIQTFVQTERWPFTTQGLFQRLKNGIKDPSLIEAFCFTQEFMMVDMLFQRSDIKVEQTDILNVLRSGSWELFYSFVKEQKKEQDLSAKRRQEFLVKYIDAGSKQAAYLILKTDLEDVTKKLDNQSVLNILNSLEEKKLESERFALALLTSPRNDAVWELAAKRLYEYAGEEHPKKFKHHAALSRFVSHKTIQPQEIEKDVCLYVVEEGDSLWKIAQKNSITIEDIVEANDLKTHVLQPGHVLELPL